MKMKYMIRWMMSLVIAGLGFVFGPNCYIKMCTETCLETLEEASKKGKDTKHKPDCILVLGAKVRPSGQPSKMLRDRINKGIELYHAGAASKIIMSGERKDASYDEVGLMKRYAVERGVPEEAIIMDGMGLSTFDSMYRAKHIYKIDDLIIVTQKYHQFRSIYIAEKMGMKACGVIAKDVRYHGQTYRDFRELLARDKDFFKCIIKSMF